MSVSCSREFQLRACKRSHQSQYKYGHILIPRCFCSCLHVSHKRTASHLHPSSSLSSSSNRSRLFKHLAFFVQRQKTSRVISRRFFLFAALSSFFRVIVVVVVLVVRVVVVAVCAFLSQNAHRHVTICIRECTASSSSCVSCSTSHLILVFHTVRAYCVPLLQNAHWLITVCIQENTARPPPAVSLI